MSMIIEFTDLQGDVMQMFNEQKQQFSLHINDEDREIINIPFSKLLYEWQEKYSEKGNIEKSLSQYNMQQQQLKFAGNAINKNDSLASIFSKKAELDPHRFLHFENKGTTSEFLTQLGQHYNKELHTYIEKITVETDNVKKLLKQKIEYYQDKKAKLQELLETVKQLQQYQREQNKKPN